MHLFPLGVLVNTTSTLRVSAWHKLHSCSIPEAVHGRSIIIFFEKVAGALLCHLREMKQVRVITVPILHKINNTLTQKQDT